MSSLLHIPHCLLLFLVMVSPVTAGDWPQILGPQRNGVAADEKLAERWPQSGPEELWSSPVGEGFAGVAVQADVVYLFHRQDGAEVIEARRAANGQEIWRQSFPCRYRGGVSSDSGPRCVPLVTEDHVYVFGVTGELRCLRTQDGASVWTRDTARDFSAPEGYFGTGSSPLLYQNRLIVNVGGRDNAAVVAFSAQTGETQWQSFSDTASYSSPVMAQLDGTAQALVVTRNHLLSLQPASGVVQFQIPFGRRGPTVNGATPVVLNEHVFVSSSYRVGSVWASLSSEADQPVRIDEEFLATQYATPVVHDDLLFAVDGRQDVGQATIKCIDPARQTVLWQKTGFDYGTMIRVESELLLLTCGGELIRIAADPQQYREIQRSQVLEASPSGYRLPALSNGRLFVRDDRTLKALNMGR